jgi:D-Tyr-tRNAtyr deacylase
VATGDGPDDVRYLTDKILHLRIFEDEQGKFQYSLLDAGGGCLLVSSSRSSPTPVAGVVPTSSAPPGPRQPRHS